MNENHESKENRRIIIQLTLEGEEKMGFLDQNGTTPLTGNWDAGDYKIISRQLSLDGSLGLLAMEDGEIRIRTMTDTNHYIKWENVGYQNNRLHIHEYGETLFSNIDGTRFVVGASATENYSPIDFVLGSKLIFGGLLGDTNLYRGAANQLKTDDDFRLGTITATDPFVLGINRTNYYSSGTGGMLRIEETNTINATNGTPDTNGLWTLMKKSGTGKAHGVVSLVEAYCTNYGTPPDVNESICFNGYIGNYTPLMGTPTSSGANAIWGGHLNVESKTTACNMMGLKVEIKRYAGLSSWCEGLNITRQQNRLTSAITLFPDNPTVDTTNIPGLGNQPVFADYGLDLRGRNDYNTFYVKAAIRLPASSVLSLGGENTDGLDSYLTYNRRSHTSPGIFVYCAADEMIRLTNPAGDYNEASFLGGHFKVNQDAFVVMPARGSNPGSAPDGAIYYRTDGTFRVKVAGNWRSIALV